LRRRVYERQEGECVMIANLTWFQIVG